MENEELKQTVESGGSALNDRLYVYEGVLKFEEALKVAVEQPTLLDALTWICVWESERVIDQARFRYGSGVNGAGWDTCFKYCIEQVMQTYRV